MDREDDEIQPDANAPEEIEPAPWTLIRDEGHANRIIQRYAELAEEEARVKAQTKRRLERIKADRAALDRRWLSALEQWARVKLAGGKRKSLLLEDGGLAFTSRGERVEMEAPAEEALEALRKARPEEFTARTVFEPNRRADYIAADILKTTGEVVDGWRIVPASETFAVRLPKAADEPDGK